MNGHKLDGTPTFKTFGGPRGIVLLVAAKLKTEQTGVDEAKIIEARSTFAAQGIENASIERRRVGDYEGLELIVPAETPDGEVQTTFMCVVAAGKEVYMLQYIAPGTRAEYSTDWAGMIAGYKVTGQGFGWWPYAAGGLALVLLLGFAFRGSRNPQFQGSRPQGESMIRGATDMTDAMPSSGSLSRPYSEPPSHAGAPAGGPSASPAPAAPAHAEASPQIPGLRSTLPPSGRWSD